MQKAFDNFFWRNSPSTESPLNEQNLMKINNGLNTVDDRVIALDTTKFDKTEAQGLIKGWALNTSNGIVTITYYNGATATIDTLLGKLAVNFDFDEATQRMIIYLSDGTQKYVDLSAFLTPLEFIDSGTIDFQLVATGKVTAIVKEGSIEEKHLQPNYLADIRAESAKAESSRDVAAQSAENANNYANLSKSYAVGTGGQVRPNDADDNAKKYSESAQAGAQTSREYLTKVEKAGEDAVKAINDALGNEMPQFSYDFKTGILYCNSTRFIFTINNNNGILYWGVGV